MDLSGYDLLESAPDAVLVVDDQGAIVFLNQQAEQLFGYSRLELRGEPVECLIPLRSRPGHEALRAAYIARPELRPMGAGLDLQARRKDGSEFPVDISISPLNQGQHRRVICAIRDVSAHHAAEVALRESEARYRSLVHGATYGIYLAAVDGRLHAVNAALVSMLGYDSEAALLDVNARELYADPEERDRLIAQYGGGRLISGIDVRWKRRDGSLLTVKLSGRIIRERDGDPPTAFEVIVEDISQRRLLEQRLRTAERLETAGRLTAGIAHHFNNLLAVMVGRLDAVRVQLPDDSPAQPDVAMALDAARRATTLVRQLNDFGQQTDAAPSRIDLNALLTELRPLLESEVSDAVSIVLDLADRVPPILADRTHLEGIIVTLLTNAREALPDGGTFTLATEPSSDGRRARLIARDTGVGVDPAILRRVFDPFFTTRAFGRGSGLGLSAVYGLVTRSGGTIHAESAADRGTTFTIEWPAA